MGRSKKRKREEQHQQRHIDGRVLPLLYTSAGLCTLHDLLVALLLPSLQKCHAPSPKSAALSPSSLSIAAGPEVLLHAGRVAETEHAADMGIQCLHLGYNIHTQHDTQAATAFHVSWQKQAASTDNIKQQEAPTIEMEASLSAVAHSLLVCEGDPADYLSLLHHCYVVLPDTAPPIGSTVLEQRWSHQQVIHRVIQILFKQGRNSSNVLCFGFQQPRPRSSLKREKTAPAGLACVTDNAAVGILNSQTWRRIHSRVGDLIMLHLLSYADIFHPLPRKCYVQVAGTSVLLRAQQFKNPAKWVVPTDESFAERQDSLVKQGRMVGLNGSDNKKLNTYVYCSANSCADGKSKQRVDNFSVHDQNAITRKRQRPYSWQRRKMRRFTGREDDRQGSHNVLEPSESHIEPDSQEFLVRASELSHSSFLEVVESGPATQGKFVTAVGVEAGALANSQKVNRSYQMLELTCLQKASLWNKAKNDRRILPIPAPFSQKTFISTVAAVNQQPNDATKDRQQRVVGCASSSFSAKPSYDNQQEQARKVSNGERSGVVSAKFCNSSGYCVGIGARRLINRSRMFYRGKFPHHAGLPKSHLLQRLKPTYKDAAILFKAIFGMESLCKSNTCGKSCFVCLKKCSKCMCCLLKRLISNAQRCQYARFLKRHCSPCATSVSQSSQSKLSAKRYKVYGTQKGFVGTEKVQPEKEEHGFSSHNQVVAFIWAVCRRIVPEELLGSKKNWRLLRRNVHAFVSLRRHESFSLEQGMYKLRLSEYSWVPDQCLHGCRLHKELGDCPIASIGLHYELEWGDCVRLGHARTCPKNSSLSRRQLKKLLLENWIFWLFSGLIIPLIQAHFYVTESEKFKQNVLFYRKSVWAKIKATAVKEMVKCNFKKLSLQSTTCLLKKGSLGFSRARLLPKKVGTRLIANLGSSSAFPSNCTLNKVAMSKRISKRKKRCENLSNSCAQKVISRESRRDGMSLLFKPINLVLRDIHNCLKYEQENHEEDLGCSVFDYNDTYLKLLPYIVDKRVLNANAPSYLVVCDALKAFDSIKQDKLLDIVCEFIREEEYCVRRFAYASPNRRFAYASPNMKSVKVFHERSATSTIKDVTSLDSFLSLAANQRNAVCIDLAYSVKLKRSHVLQVLKEHILRNILQIGQHYYLQVVGIPQGSILSSLLCSLYYGHFERSRLACTLHLDQRHNSPNVCKPSSHLLTKSEGTSCLETHQNTQLLRSSSVNGFAASMNCVSSQNHGSGSQSMRSLSCKDSQMTPFAMIREDSEPRNIMLRLVDDWLFISNSRDDALEFVRRMHRGFSDYNCVANRLKTAVNFDAPLGGSAIEMNIYRTQDGACFIRWSGLLINCNTLEVQADYTRYCGINLQSTLTVWRINNQGIYLMTKLCQFMRPKCHPIFYDSNINCPATVFLNAYQAFTLCAMKFHAYNRSVPCGGKCNPKFGLKAILKCARYMHSLLAHRTQKISKRSQVKPLLLLQAKETLWLALRAFDKVLRRKQSRYARLLYLIKSELLSPKYEGLSETPLMLSALDARRSSMFESILY